MSKKVSTGFKNGVVAANHPLVAEASLKILKNGGNVVDAAVTNSAGTVICSPTKNDTVAQQNQDADILMGGAERYTTTYSWAVNAQTAGGRTWNVSYIQQTTESGNFAGNTGNPGCSLYR